MTVMLVVATFPEVSVARAWTVFAPSARVREPDHEVVPAAGTHVVPSKLTSTFETATSSVAVPETVTEVVVNVAPLAGEVIATDGFVVSGAGPTTIWLEDVFLNPSLSVAVKVTV